MPTYRKCFCCGDDCVSDTEDERPTCLGCFTAGCEPNEASCKEFWAL
jgi:hypothetical protein